jgi:hypothetical protein
MGDFTNVHIIRHVLSFVENQSGSLSRTPAATDAILYVARSTLASLPTWGQGLMMLVSQSSSLRTRNVGNEGLEFITLARHGQNGPLEH